MLKYFCDLCESELTYETVIHIDPRIQGFYSRFLCLSCFQNKKNWDKIKILITTKSIDHRALTKV